MYMSVVALTKHVHLLFALKAGVAMSMAATGRQSSPGTLAASVSVQTGRALAQQRRTQQCTGEKVLTVCQQEKPLILLCTLERSLLTIFLLEGLHVGAVTA